MSNEKYTVVVVDDHDLFRAGTKAMLDDRFDVVGEAADAQSAVRIINDLQPNVVLLDVHLPMAKGLSPDIIGIPGRELGGERVIVDTTTSASDTRFLALSVSDSPEDVGAVIRAGALGYITKTISAEDLNNSLAQVAQGFTVFSPKLAGFVLQAFAAESASNSTQSEAPVGQSAVDADTVNSNADSLAYDEQTKIEDLSTLSAREREVLQLIARGYAYKEVAVELFISTRTVETHVHHVLKKLQLTNRNEITYWATRRGIV